MTKNRVNCKKMDYESNIYRKDTKKKPVEKVARCTFCLKEKKRKNRSVRCNGMLQQEKSMNIYAQKTKLISCCTSLQESRSIPFICLFNGVKSSELHIQPLFDDSISFKSNFLPFRPDVSISHTVLFSLLILTLRLFSLPFCAFTFVGPAVIYSSYHDGA